jgi:anti-sigma factor RsiW
MRPATMGDMPMNTMVDCTTMRSQMADLLLDPATVAAEVHAHAKNCARCHKELAELQATMAALDAWEAPEPNPYFLTRFKARLSEERALEPVGLLARWVARFRAGVNYGPSKQLRPLAATASTLLLLIGSGTYLGLTNWTRPAQPQTEATVVNDLQTMDNNAQVLDQLESLSNNEDGN